VRRRKKQSPLEKRESGNESEKRERIGKREKQFCKNEGSLSVKPIYRLLELCV